MWPHERHQHYRLPGIVETQEHHQSQRSMHLAMAAPSIRQSNDPSIVARHVQQEQREANHQQQMQRSQLSQQPMAPPGPSNPRASRNMAEKQRRDNLNTNISNMAALVPTVAGSPRRLDKISILRLAATYLRTKYALGAGKESFLPRKFDKFDLEKFLFETLVQNDGFMLVVTSTGKIVYVGRQVEQYLGHAQADLLGQSIYNYVFPDDREELTRNLTPSESMNRLMLTESHEEDSIESEDSRSIGGSGMPFGDERRSFDLRMSQRAASRREHTQYECLHISGLLRPAEACRNTENERQKKGLHEMNATSNDIIFVGIARMRKRRITELSLLEANKEEYVTRHLVDGRIIFCDHRISVVAGYMTHEVSGMSAFKYMHAEDVLWTIVALRQMYDRGEGFGSSCYRLKTKTGEYIYLRTHAYIEVDQDRRLFQSFICVNTSVSKEEGEKLVNDMKVRYSATMSGQSNALQPFAPKVAVKDPLQLDDAINSLISDIASRPVSEDGLSNASSNVPDVQSMKAVCVSQHLPPASIHANEIGIKCIDRPLPSSGKDKSIKRETSVSSPGSTHSRQNDNSRDFEAPHGQGQSNVSNVNARCAEKIMPENLNTDEKKLFHSQSTASNSRHGKRDEDYYKSEASSSCSSSMLTEDCSPSNNRESMKSPRVAATVQPCSRGKPESMFAHVKMEKLDHGNEEMIQRSKSSAIKRPNSNDTPSSSTKKRRGNKSVGTCETKVTTSLDNNDSSIGNYEPNNQFPPFVNYKNDRMLNQSPIICKTERTTGNGNGINARFENGSPCSSLHDLPIDYQPLNPSNVELTVYGDDFPDLQSDSFLSSELNDNPENLDERTIQQFPTSDQAVSEGLKRTHMELENRMTLQTNELSVLEHKLKTPAFQSEFFKPRETLIELRAEHTKNTRMLQTIQQDHMNNMQTNSMKQNIGV